MSKTKKKEGKKTDTKPHKTTKNPKAPYSQSTRAATVEHEQTQSEQKQ
jgi:hypothetical protein